MGAPGAFKSWTYIVHSQNLNISCFIIDKRISGSTPPETWQTADCHPRGHVKPGCGQICDKFALFGGKKPSLMTNWRHMNMLNQGVVRYGISLHFFGGQNYSLMTNWRPCIHLMAPTWTCRIRVWSDMREFFSIFGGKKSSLVTDQQSCICLTFVLPQLFLSSSHIFWKNPTETLKYKWS